MYRTFECLYWFGNFEKSPDNIVHTMRLSFFHLSLVLGASALPSQNTKRADLPAYWVLTGDSTTAPKGGWVDGFLATTVSSGSSGRNFGHSGASTASFRAGGDWSNVVKEIKARKDKNNVLVTIQVRYWLCLGNGMLTHGSVWS